MVITKTITMDLSEQRPQAADVMQNDTCSRAMAFHLRANGEKWIIPAGVRAAVSYRKSDSTVGLYDTLPDGTAAVTIKDNVATAVLAPQVLTVAGLVELTVVLWDGLGKRLATFGVNLIVHADPAAGVTESDHYVNLHSYLPQPANAAVVGQILEIEEVTAAGQVSKLRAVDAVGGSGTSGTSPHIGENGNWWIGKVDTGVQAAGKDGYTPVRGTDYWTEADKRELAEQAADLTEIPFFDLAAMGLDPVGTEGATLSADAREILEALKNGAVKVGFYAALDETVFVTAVIHGVFVNDGNDEYVATHFVYIDGELKLDVHIHVGSFSIAAIAVPEKDVMPNPKALTFTGAVSATYDGSEAVSIEIPTDAHINSLIHTALGVIENGTY